MAQPREKIPILACRNLSKIFADGNDRVFAVKEASFELFAGEFVCLRGPSGSGKSTLLRLLGGIDEASGGDILFQGAAYAQLGSFGIAALRRRKIGFVLQELALINYLSAVENVELPLLFAGEPPAQCRIQAQQTLRMVGLEHRACHLPPHMSAGERQRAAIARALLAKPAVLIADEPSSSLDTANTKQIVDIFEKLCRDGVAVLVATHDDRILTQAQRVVSIQDGTLLNESPKTKEPVHGCE